MDEILHKNIKFLEKDLLDYFLDTNLLKNLYKIRSESMLGKIEHNVKIELQIDIIENEVLGILEKREADRSEKEKKILNLARNYYSTFIYINKLSSIFCKFYESKNMKKLFSADDCKNINIYKENMIKNSYDYYCRFMNGKFLSEREQTIMFSFLTARIGNASEKIYIAQKNLIKKLLTMKENYVLAGKNFYIQFITYEKCKKLGLSTAKVYMSNYDFSGKKAEWLGVSIGNSGLILMDEDYLKNSSNAIFSPKNVNFDVAIAQTMYHELEHYRQACLMMSGIVNKTAMNMVKNCIFRQYLTTDEFDEYKSNYHYRETEREANITGWRETVDFFMEYSPKDRLRDIQKASTQHCKTFLEQSYSWQDMYINGKRRSYSLEDYNVRALNIVVKNNPNMVREFSQLQLFFHDDGMLKNGGELLRDYTKIFIDSRNNRELLEVYREFFDFNFMNMNLNSINLSNFNVDEQMTLFILIQEAYSRECRQLKRMMDVYDNTKENSFNFIGKMRIERIKKYYNYLNSNQGVIRELSKKSKVKHFGLLYSDSLKNDVESFESRIRHNPIFRGTLLEKEIFNLTKLMGEEEYGRIYGSRTVR